MNKIEADHFKHYKYPYRLEISEGGALAYAVASVDVEKNEYPVNLYIRKADSPEDETLVMENIELTSFFWRGESLIINALMEKDDKDKSEKGLPLSVVYEYDLPSGALKQLFRLCKKIEYLAPLAEYKWLMACTDDLRIEALLEACGGDEGGFLKQKEQEDNYIIADEYPFRMDDGGYVNKVRQRLYVYENGALKRVSPEMMNIGAVKAFGTEYAVFAGVEYTSFWNGEDQRLYHVDFATLEISLLDPKEYVYTALCPADPGHVVAVRSDKALYGASQDEYIDCVSIKDNKGKMVKRINGDCELHVQNSIYTNFSYGMEGKRFIPCDGGVYFIATVLDKSYIYFGDFETGEARPVTDGSMLIEDFQINGANIFMLAMERLWGPEIYMCGKDGENLIQITHYNDRARGAYTVSEPEGFTFMSKDGEAEIYGYQMKPTGFEAGKKYPAVLFIHGGPNMAYAGCFYHDMQLLANHGYGVLYCNPRGSVGHGGEFSDLRLKYYTVDYDDIMQFLDEALSRNPWVDAQRLGMVGGSYGGMMVNWIIGHSERFKAAVSDRGVAFEMQDYFMSDIGVSYAKDVYGKEAWDEGGAEDMWEKSSIKYAPFVKTPTLFLHAVNDYRCSKEQGIMMFSALKFFGIPSRLVMIDGENHNYAFDGKPKNRIRRFEEILGWYKKYL